MRRIEKRNRGDVEKNSIVDHQNEGLQQQDHQELRSAAVEAWGQSALEAHERFLRRTYTEDVRAEVEKDEKMMLERPLRVLFRPLTIDTIRFFQAAANQGILTKEDVGSPVALDANELLGRAHAGVLPAEAIVKLMMWRREVIEKQNLEWRERFVSMKEEYGQILANLITEGLIPPNERYQEMLDKAVILVQDPLGKQLAGEHTGALVIEMRVEGRETWEIRKSVFHELNHLLAGKNHIEQQVVEEQDVKKDSVWQTEQILVPRYHLKKDGLAFPAHHPDKELDLPPNWLNEGITEMLARRMAGVTEATSYSVERRAIQALIDNGVDFKLFVHAYFESLDPQNKERGYPAFRELNKAIVALRGKGWFNRIQGEVDEEYRLAA